MKKVQLGKTGLMVTPVIYGGIVSMKDGQEASDRYVKWSLERGINYYDVAPVYEDAQEKLGNSLIGKRDEIYLACKTTTRTYLEAEKEMTESFRLLHTDHFDVYQLHAVSTKEEIDIAFGKGGIMELLFKAKDEGKIAHIGLTGHNEEAILYALSKYDFETVMYPINWNIHMGQGNGEKLCQLKKERGYGILGMKNQIERAWKNNEERYSSKFPKSWCKPFDPKEDPEAAISAMRYALHIGADVLIPPGNFESFSFCIENMEKGTASYTKEDEQILRDRFTKFGHLPFLLEDKGMINESENEL